MPRPRSYCRRPGLDTRIVDGEAFVITRSTIQHLNATATAAWLAIEEPMRHADIADLLHELYPQVPRAVLSADLRKLLAAWQRMGLLAEPETGC